MGLVVMLLKSGYLILGNKKKVLYLHKIKKEMISVVRTNTMKIDRFAGWKPDAGVV